ncbi:hypothetical protein PROSTU_02499 [Providencia stuartii ATCC 25827]|uniref:Uncharacterized protein n=1 Tax=Providencia stuartii ATCC 25827 TaxID=471874 RepID=A0AA87CT28_PROST|nr:hypothetical protein PROSTU_02499 [Providencia stuartii ATCC 25827]
MLLIERNIISLFFMLKRGKLACTKPNDLISTFFFILKFCF